MVRQVQFGDDGNELERLDGCRPELKVENRDSEKLD
jgi:hypothetical protein